MSGESASRATGDMAKKRFKGRIFLLFVQDLLSLMRTGLLLREALVLTIDRTDEPVPRLALQRILIDVEGGMLFSQACAFHPDAFDCLFLAALKAGEKTCELSVVLSRHLNFLRRQVVSLRKAS